MSDKCVIISGGERSPLDTVSTGDYVIACDKGYEYAISAGIVPDLVVGDFDSYSGQIPEGIPIVRFFSEKDDTDTMIAIRYALDQGYRNIELHCALGGRLDHALANIQAAVFAAQAGASVIVSDSKTIIYTLTHGEMRLEKRDGYSLSLLSATDTCTGVTISGAKYPLNEATITNSFPIGVSNMWKDERVLIKTESGILLVILSKI